MLQNNLKKLKIFVTRLYDEWCCYITGHIYQEQKTSYPLPLPPPLPQKQKENPKMEMSIQSLLVFLLQIYLQDYSIIFMTSMTNIFAFQIIK